MTTKNRHFRTGARHYGNATYPADPKPPEPLPGLDAAPAPEEVPWLGPNGRRERIKAAHGTGHRDTTGVAYMQADGGREIHGRRVI